MSDTARNICSEGALIDVCIGVPIARERVLLRHGMLVPHPLKIKLTMSAFYSLMLLPKERARSLLEYRFSVGKRSAAGLIRAMAS